MAVSGSQTDVVGGKFAHILQPIKDLTKNWEVDIASLLEDYLEELENISISFDGGQSTMNFSQAAMLVQSSAGVYSKKVDYLHRLVSDVLNLLANKRKQGQKQSADDVDGNEGDTGVHNDDDDEEFLNLDDIHEGKNIYMKEDFDSREEFVFLPEMPLCLVPLEGEKGENPLLSKKGEVLASRKDFKMNTCHMHLSGAMLLDLTHLKLLEESLKHINSGDPVEMDTRPADLIEPTGVSPDTSTGDDHADFGDIAADEIDGGVPLVEVSEPEPMEVENPLAGQGDVLRRSDRHRQATLIAVPVQPQIDPWEPLDPHIETKTAKPVKHRGTIFKRCPGLEGTSKKRKRGSKPAPSLDPLSKYISRASNSYTYKIPVKSQKALLFSELEKILFEEISRRQTLLKEHKDLPWSAGDAEEDNDEAGEPDVDSFQGTDEGLGGEELEPLVDENLFNAINEGLRCNASFAQHHMPPELLGDEIAVDSYEDLVRKRVEEYVASAQDYAQITELSRRVSEWEEKVIPRLEEEDNHAPFNINTYSSDILGRLQMGNIVSFEKVVEGKPTYETCRTFLATLMLANTGNVQIEAMAGDEGSLPTFGLKLLSTKRHFEELQEYQAPSVSQTKNT